MELSRVLEALIVLKYLDANDIGLDTDSAQFRGAVTNFQSRYGLKVDGIAGPLTRRKITQWRYCAVPDTLREAGAPLARWVHPARPLPIMWAIGSTLSRPNNGALPGVTTAQLVAVYAAAWNQWAVHANLNPQMAASLQEAWVQMGSGRIDGANSTLAWSYLPDGRTDRQLEQRYDINEPWDISLDQPSNQRISLLAVATHEIGHALGLDHGGQGLMAPYYDPDKLSPQPGYDVDQVQQRYGQVVAPPAPPTDPPFPPTDPPLPPGVVPDIEITLANGQVVRTQYIQRIQPSVLTQQGAPEPHPPVFSVPGFQQPALAPELQPSVLVPDSKTVRPIQ